MKVIDIPRFNIRILEFRKSNLTHGVKKVLAKTGRFYTTLKGCSFQESAVSQRIEDKMDIVINGTRYNWNKIIIK